MSDGGIKRIGAHDTGFWDKENPIQAEKKALAKDLTIDQAMAKAKEHDGAELIVVDNKGKASVHALSVEDSFWAENKSILISEMDRDPKKKQDMGKTPLAIDDFVAQAFKGEAAFLVDEKNKSTYLGGDVDQTTNSVKLKDAEKFLKNPTAETLETAYAIAKDGGNERHVDKALSHQVLDQLHNNYRAQGEAGRQVGLLKSGDAQNKMQGLLGELKSLAGQESSRVAELTKTLTERTQKFEKDIVKPTQNRDAALKAWRNASASENQKVDQAAYQLREARMPGVHQTEKELKQAQSHNSTMRSQLQTATDNRVRAESNVRDLERIPAQVESHLNKASQLENENAGLYMQIQTYTLTTLSRVNSDLRQVDNQLLDMTSQLNAERSKPDRPSGGGSSDPYGKDPFAGGGSSNDIGRDPFAGGGSSSDPYGKDPFADSSKYRDSSRISQLERSVSSLKSERSDLEDRQEGLEYIQRQLTFTQDVSRLSTYFYRLEYTDRIALGQYKTQKDNNDKAINSHERQANQLKSRYRNNIDSARRNLSSATTNESAARARYEDSEQEVAGIERNLREIKGNPRPDTHAQVKPKFNAYNNAVSHRESTVGADATLTKNRDQTQATVDKITGDFRSDKAGLENNINNVQQSLQSDARQKISATRQSIK